MDRPRRGVAAWVAAAILACTVAACVTAGPGTPVRARGDVGILVAPSPQVRDGQVTVGCAAALIEGELVEDLDTGVAILDGGSPRPVVWPTGYSARRAGSEVQVLDASGGVVATTGEVVSMGGGAIDGGGVRWWACDRGIAPLASP